VNAAPAVGEIAPVAMHNPRKATVVALLAGGVIDACPSMLMRIGNRSWSEGQHRIDRSDRKRPSEVTSIPLWAGADPPLHIAKVAELVATATCRMEAALLQLDHVLALAALLPSATPGQIHEKLDVWVAGHRSL
jgi:hypothetical protein